MIIIVCSVAIFISIQRYSWMHFAPGHHNLYSSSSSDAAEMPASGTPAVAGVRSNTAIVAMSVNNGTAPYGYTAAPEPQFTGGKMGMLGGGGFAETGGSSYGTSIEPTILLWVVIFAVAFMIMLAVGQCQIIAALWRICSVMRIKKPSRGTVGFGSEDEPLLGGHSGGESFFGLFGGQPAGSSATTVGEDSPGVDGGAPGVDRGKGAAAPRAPAAPTRQQKWESFVSSILPPSARMRLRRPTVV